MSVKAKFQCNSITDYGALKTIALSAIKKTDGDNADFAKATPFGDIKMNIDSSTPAFNAFAPGGVYYVTFEEA